MLAPLAATLRSSLNSQLQAFCLLRTAGRTREDCDTGGGGLGY